MSDILNKSGKSVDDTFILKSSTAKLSRNIFLLTPENGVECTKLEALEVNMCHCMKESGVIKQMLGLNYKLQNIYILRQPIQSLQRRKAHNHHIVECWRKALTC